MNLRELVAELLKNEAPSDAEVIIEARTFSGSVTRVFVSPAHGANPVRVHLS